MQAAGDLVAVLVELAAGVQFGHHDLRRRPALFVVLLDVGGDAAPVVDDRNGVVRMDDDLDVVAVPRQRLVDGVVEHLEYHVMETRAIGGVPDVHAGALANRIEALQDLDACRVVVFAVELGFGLRGSHYGFRCCCRHCKVLPNTDADSRVGAKSIRLRSTIVQIRIGMTTYL